MKRRTYLIISVVFCSLAATSTLWADDTDETNPGASQSSSLQDPGTIKMVELLAKIEREANPGSPYLNKRRMKKMEDILTGVTDEQFEVRIRLRLAVEMLRAGESEKAAEECRRVEGLSSAWKTPLPPEAIAQLRDLLALSYLRLGEQQNSIALHGADSCLIPIKGDGIHTDQTGSRKAIEVLEENLKTKSEDYSLRWLLNVAYMTVGEYPDKVPAQWRIPPSVFESDYDIKRFYNVAGKSGLNVVGLSGGAIMEDFDGDGFLDVMMSSWGLSDQVRFFKNNGDGTFTDKTNEAGLTGIVGGLNMTHADYDNDGYPDVLILRGAWMQDHGQHPNSLLRNNGNGTFSDVTEAAGILSLHPTQTATWGDYNNDGWLDLYIGNETEKITQNQHPCELFHNNGDGTFTECAEMMGIDDLGYIKAVAFGDFNNDGRQDIYISGHKTNALYRNDGPKNPAPNGQKQSTGTAQTSAKPIQPWRFTNVAEEAGVTEPRVSFPTWFWDYDNDGWLDIFVSGYGWENEGDVMKDYMNIPNKGVLPRLYRNNADETFTDVTKEAKVDKLLLTMGSNYGDLDNDGYLDFYAGTGTPSLLAIVPNRMFRNDHGESFQDVTTSGGFGNIQKGHGVAFGDIDNDGDQDIFVVMGGAYSGDVYPNILLENPGHGNHWITIRVEGVQSNRAGIGARIRVRVDTGTGENDIYAMVGTGGSFGSSSLQQEIGLGKAKAIKEIEIKWPTTGLAQTFQDVKMNQIIKIREGDPKVKQIQSSSFSLSGPTP